MLTLSINKSSGSARAHRKHVISVPPGPNRNYIFCSDSFFLLRHAYAERFLSRLRDPNVKITCKCKTQHCAGNTSMYVDDTIEPFDGVGFRTTNRLDRRSPTFRNSRTDKFVTLKSAYHVYRIFKTR